MTSPMEFVIIVLQELFGKDRETATQIMLKIHLDGRGVCGVYSRDVAATKVEQVLQAAPKAGPPLQAMDGLPFGGSEEHTSEIQSPNHSVFRLLLVKKKKHNHTSSQIT